MPYKYSFVDSHAKAKKAKVGMTSSKYPPKKRGQNRSRNNRKPY